MNEIRAARQLPEDPDLKLQDFVARTALYHNPRFRHIDPVFAIFQLIPRWYRIYHRMLRNRRILERNGSVQPKYEPYRTRLTVCALKFRRHKKGKVLQCSIYIGRHEVLALGLHKTPFFHDTRKSGTKVRTKRSLSVCPSRCATSATRQVLMCAIVQ